MYYHKSYIIICIVISTLNKITAQVLIVIYFMYYHKSYIMISIIISTLNKILYSYSHETIIVTSIVVTINDPTINNTINSVLGLWPVEAADDAPPPLGLPLLSPLTVPLSLLPPLQAAPQWGLRLEADVQIQELHVIQPS